MGMEREKRPLSSTPGPDCQPGKRDYGGKRVCGAATTVRACLFLLFAFFPYVRVLTARK